MLCSKPCKIWNGAIGSSGYGRTKNSYVHRLEWEKHYGPIPAGHEIHHRCEVKTCYEITHLECILKFFHWQQGNSLPAQNARKELCSRGHEFVYRKDGTGRMCNICNYEKQKERRGRARAV